MARYEAKIKEGAAPFLEEGEEVLAAVMARPRGWTQSNASAGGGALAGVVGGAIGGKKQQQNIAPPSRPGSSSQARWRWRSPSGASCRSRSAR